MSATRTWSVLVTGATGYIGGRLVPRLLELGHRVRVLVRDPSSVEGRPWRGKVEVVRGDLSRPETLPAALEGIEVAYYLVHSMHAGRDFARRDREAALAFREAAAGLEHLIYLGGLLPRRRGSRRAGRSEHLASRAEIGRLLAAGLPITEFRAGPIIGSGSASFEMVRYATERLPLILAPREAWNPVQPIAVRDVLSYLVLALERGPCGVVEIGTEPLSFVEMMRQYAAGRGLRRRTLRLPIRTPAWLGALWMDLATPVPRSIARPLLEGMVRPLTARTRRASRHFPEVTPLSYAEAVRLALERVGAECVETRWSDAAGPPRPYDYAEREGMMLEVRRLEVAAPAARVLEVCTGLGGARGWPGLPLAWRLRGAVDQLLGGPGLARGRRHRDELLVGDALDLWRVERLEGDLLRLRSEARLPGLAWLEWRVEPRGVGCRLTQTLAFAPRGALGALYGRLLRPAHRLVLGRLVRAIARRAARAEPTTASVAALPPARPPASPPRASTGLLDDLRLFLLRREGPATRIPFASPAEREEYSRRILQRLGRDLSGYSVLNLHRIGVEAPARHVFETLLQWDRDSTCWPNELATVERVGEGVEHLRVTLLGRRRRGARPLFELRLVDRSDVPSAWDPDNGRYLVYRCEGGYPVGIFAFYVRSSLPERGETGRTQLFVGVGFDFYGRERWPLFHPVNRVWEAVHDRVMRNQLARFAALCEWRFQRLQEGG
jgi:uncharacterized protein YbjT (DUF2867 family)